MILFFALALAFFLIAGFVTPFIGLLGLLFINMTNPGELFPIFATLHVERLMVLVVLLASLRQGKPKFNTLTTTLFVFWGAMMASIPFSVWPGGAFSFVMDFGHLVLYHLLTATLVDTPKRVRIYLLMYVVLIGWVAGGSLWAYAHGQYDRNALRNGFERAEGLTESAGNPNGVALTLANAMPVMALMFIAGDKKNKVLLAGIFCLSVAALLLTGSRTGFIVFLLLPLSYLLKRKKGWLMLPFVALAFIAIWSFTPQQYKERYSTIDDVLSGKQNDASYEEHEMTRKIGMRMFLDNPIFGVGAGQFGIAGGTQYWKHVYLQAHNLYIQLAAELGLVGIIAWAVFFITFLKSLLRLRAKLRESDAPVYIRYFPTACLYCFLALFVEGWTGHNLYRALWYQLAGLTAALTIMYGRPQEVKPTKMEAASVGTLQQQPL